MLFAATYPTRVAALVLYGGLARALWAPDYPLGMQPAAFERMLAEESENWSDPEYLEQSARMFFGDDAPDAEVQAAVNLFRYGATPGSILDLDRLNGAIDVRPALPTIQAATLVVHQRGDPWVPVGHGRYLAEHIAGARLVELAGNAHSLREAQIDPFMREVRNFLTEVTSGGWRAPEPDRVLATVVFTDIVGSTARAAELGDRAWRQLLERHHTATRRELRRFRGVEHDTAGDGFFASFDGPARAIRCAIAVRDSLRELDLDVRVGLHTGECELMDDKVAGIAVSIGARVAAQAGPGEVLVSQTVKDLVAGSGIVFEDRGAAELKGVPGEWRMYAVAGF